MLFPRENKLVSMEKAIASINDGDMLLIGGEFNGRVPAALVREVLRQRKKNLTLVGHASGISLDLLCAGGCATEIQLTRLSFEREFGNAYNYRRAVENGKIRSKDQCCPVINQQLRASAFGLPWMPIMPHISYTDFMKLHPEWKLMDDPMRPGEKIVLVPALKPNVYLVHCSKADIYGNWVVEHESFNEMLYSKAADRVIVSAEEIVTTEELRKTCGLMFPPHFDPFYPFFKTSHVVHLLFGAHPTHCYPHYTYDRQHIEEYQEYASVSDERFKEYLDRYVYGCKTHDEYLEKIGGVAKLNSLSNWRKPFTDFCESKEREESQAEKITDYGIDELMVVVLSRYIQGNMLHWHGGDSYLPMAALRFAKLTHAPDIIYCGGVTGYINPSPAYLPDMANDFSYCHDVEVYYEFEHLFDLVERSETRLMFFSGAQIDKYGNVNATLLGSPDNIKVKLAGGGGTGQIMGKPPVVIIWTAAHEKRSGRYTLVDKVDFITGHGNPPPGIQYPGEIGPTACVTDLGVFSFDKETELMKLEALYPDTTVEMILENTGFKLIIPDKVPQVKPPTREQIDILRRLADPTGIRRKEFLPKQLERRFKLGSS
jgi:glutaconate CoA-transferase subunit A